MIAIALMAMLERGLNATQAGETAPLHDSTRDGRASVTIRGTGASSGPAALIEVTKGTQAKPGDLRLTVTPGSMLRNSNSAAQHMVVSGVLGRYLGELGGEVRYSPANSIVVSGTAPVTFVLMVYCAQFEKENPSTTDRFTWD